MSSSIRIIVTGLIAQYPIGGVTWDYGQFVLGLARLGHDVYYIEDTGQWPYNPEEAGLSKECGYNVNYLAGLMAGYGLAEKWAYRFPWEGRWFGISERERAEIARSADLLLNVSGVLRRPEDYRSVHRLAFLDSDPVFTQVKLARGQEDFKHMVDMHDVHFSFGENMGEEVPDTNHRWLPTRQPIVLSEWRTRKEQRDCFTTVMTWKSYNPIEFDGRKYGQKDVEFRRFIDLPGMIGSTPIEIAMSVGKAQKLPIDLLARKGWRITDPAVVCPDPDRYREYIETSKAEWSVAKNGYVQGQPGWFSCRSACYLAAGRPVVVQETGFSSVLPTGEGLLAFTDLEEAAEGIREVQADYARHSRAAREVAETHFDSEQVLSELVERAMEAPG